MQTLKTAIKRVPGIVPIVRAARKILHATRMPVRILISHYRRQLKRLRIAWSYYRDPIRQIFRWLSTSRESHNFTYDLTSMNKAYLAAFVANITNRSFEEISAYMAELENDEALKTHVNTLMKARQEVNIDPVVAFGRRIGWYAFVRACKPRIVIETGVEKGLGACVLTSALLRNKAEGCSGYYYGTEIRPEAGYLLCKEYATVGKIIYGDSIESLKSIKGTFDIFINDSDHSSEYEAREYVTIENKLNPGALILADNAHVTDELLKFSIQLKRDFLFFQEKPYKHWYPGAGIGVSFLKTNVESSGKSAEENQRSDG